jgi:hypothetical protein
VKVFVEGGKVMVGFGGMVGWHLIWMTGLFLLLILNRQGVTLLKSEVSNDGLLPLGLDLAVGGVSFGSQLYVVLVSGVEVQRWKREVIFAALAEKNLVTLLQFFPLVLLPLIHRIFWHFRSIL